MQRSVSEARLFPPVCLSGFKKLKNESRLISKGRLSFFEKLGLNRYAVFAQCVVQGSFQVGTCFALSDDQRARNVEIPRRK